MSSFLYYYYYNLELVFSLRWYLLLSIVHSVFVNYADIMLECAGVQVE